MVSRNKEKHRHRSLEGLQRCQDEFPVDIQRQKQLRLSSKIIKFLRETKFGRSPEMLRPISVDIQRQKQLRLSSKMIEFLRETKFGRSPEMSRRISHGYTEAETAPFELENDRIFT